MSAVIKEPEPAQEEAKSLATILVLAEQLPADFYTNPDYDRQIDKAIADTDNLVYPLDDEGERAAKADATAINKFATAFDKFIVLTFKAQTEAVSAWRDGKKEKTKLLLANRQRLIDQFQEKRLEKLNSIKKILSEQLAAQRAAKNVKKEFQTIADLSPMIKLTGSLTDGGKLTKKAVDFVAAIASGELNEQHRIEGRIMLVENACLRAEINPPLTTAHLGASLYADEPVFRAKLEELIAVEETRKAELEEKIRRQQEAENRRKIEAALKEQQDEANRVAAEALASKQAEKPVGNPVANQQAVTTHTTMQQVDSILAQKRLAEEDRKNPPVATGRRLVTVTLICQISIRDTVSNEAFSTYFESQLPEKIRESIKHLEVGNAARITV